jgi:hypothetical protein
MIILHFGLMALFQCFAYIILSFGGLYEDQVITLLVHFLFFVLSMCIIYWIRLVFESMTCAPRQVHPIFCGNDNEKIY